MDNVIRANTAAMNEEQLQTHIQEINRGLIALTQLPTTSRLKELQKEKQSAKDAEAWISELLEEGKKEVMEKDNLREELTLTQQKLMEMEGRTPECGHGDLEEKIRNLERQLGARAPAQADLAGDLEDTQTQLKVMRQSANEYRAQVTRNLKLTEGRTGGGGGHPEEREEKGSETDHFSGKDRKELRGWKVQLALNIARKPRTLDTEQKKLGYAVGRLEKVALAKIMPYCNEVFGDVKLDSLKTLVDMLELVFRDQDKGGTVKRELLKLKQRDY
jgi:type IV secretory pathway VirB10-like protein